MFFARAHPSRLKIKRGLSCVFPSDSISRIALRSLGFNASIRGELFQALASTLCKAIRRESSTDVPFCCSMFLTTLPFSCQI